MASRIGQGEFRNVYGHNGNNVTAGQQDYAERMNAIENQREDYYRAAGVAPGLPTMKGSYADPEVTGKGYNILIDSLGDHSVPENWVQRPVVNTEAGSNPGAPLAWGSPENPDDAVAGYGYVPCDTSEMEETFYYHSDHLGSTAYITDQQANVTQYDAYLPYGELLVDEHSSSADLPYKFNGKELDEETGLYYYGARYMNPVTSMWYGVDQLAEKYVFSGSYVYCLGNPIKLVDTDGQKPHNWNALYQSGKIIDEHHEGTWYNCAYYNKSAYDDKVVNIWLHGIVTSKYSPAAYLEMGVNSDSQRNGYVTKINKENVSRLVRRLDQEDEGWRNNKINGHSILVLHSCRAAILAQELSGTEELRDVVIIAPYTSLLTDKYTGEKVMERRDPKTWKLHAGVWGYS